jgi:hypothetical protein
MKASCNGRKQPSQLLVLLSISLCWHVSIDRGVPTPSLFNLSSHQRWNGLLSSYLIVLSGRIDSRDVLRCICLHPYMRRRMPNTAIPSTQGQWPLSKLPFIRALKEETIADSHAPLDLLRTMAHNILYILLYNLRSFLHAMRALR